MWRCGAAKPKCKSGPKSWTLMTELKEQRTHGRRLGVVWLGLAREGIVWRSVA